MHERHHNMLHKANNPEISCCPSMKVSYFIVHEHELNNSTPKIQTDIEDK